MSDATPKSQELWHTSPTGAHLCALVNGPLGWLMYLRGDGDAGFSSRNPDYTRPADEMVTFELNNGQVDEYPHAWCYPTHIIQRAIQHFTDTGLPPTFITWHNDSGDGRAIIPTEPRDPERSGRVKY